MLQTLVWFLSQFTNEEAEVCTCKDLLQSRSAGVWWGLSLSLGLVTQGPQPL